MSSDELTKFNDAISTYYKLKHKYDNQIEKEVTKIIKNGNYTNKEKRKQFDKFKQSRKCVNCGNLGGTIFKQDNNILSAKCGHIEKPCKLDIQLQRAHHSNINEEIDKLNKIININKVNTISSKLDFLFGYTSQSATLDEFNKSKTELINEVKKYQVINELYLNIVYNLSQIKQLSANNDNLLVFINSLKDLIKNFEETGNVTFLKDAIELYINNIQETVKTIRNLKYSNNTVEYNDSDNTYHLIQEPYTLAQLQISINDTKNKIIMFRK